jgi:hypothetical protein
MPRISAPHTAATIAAEGPGRTIPSSRGVHGLSGLRFAALLGGFCEPVEQLKDVVVMNS